MDFAFENMVAINFINLDNARACEVLEMRNAVREFMLKRRKISKDEHFRFIETLKKNKKNAYFAVYEESINFIGVVCINEIDLANKNAFFGIYGINHGAKLLQILRFIAFGELNLHILYAKVFATNNRAIRFYQKNGFVRCGAMIEAIKDGEKFIDLEIWALRNDSPENPPQKRKKGRK